MSGDGHKEKFQSFRELKVWQEGRAFRQFVFELVKAFPPDERYRLADQLVRSSRSVCDNISEGHGRFSFKDQLHFCIQARGSLSETLNHLYTAIDCMYISQEQLEEGHQHFKAVEALLNGYITFLRTQLKDTK